MRNRLFLDACYQKCTERVPVWYMRQAGRYDPEYRKIKQKYSLMEICAQPELAAEITCMPVHKLGVDAAILYSDIMNPVASLGIEFDIVPHVGPVIHSPIQTESDITRLKPIDVDRDLSHILQTIQLCRQTLAVPLIGFAGGPFTIASYLIEGKSSRNFRLTKQMMYRAPQAWNLLMQKLGDMILTYLRAQIHAGAQAVQCFDSWVGALSPDDFVKYVLPTLQRIFSGLADHGVPKIYFPGVASGELLPWISSLPVQVIGIDWRVTIPEARRRLQHRYAIQGNLDPNVLMAPLDELEHQARRIVAEGNQQSGFIFNLGHGLFPEASLEKLKYLTAFVQDYSRQFKILNLKKGELHA